MSQALRHAGYQALTLLPAATIGAAAAGVLSAPAFGLVAMQSVTVQFTFLYGAGGTSVKAYLQTTLDGGATWMDIASCAFTTAAATRLFSVRSNTAVAANVTPGSLALADNTILDGLLGSGLRVAYTSTGTYTGATSLAVHAVTKGA